MSRKTFSRRAFLGQAAAGPAADLISSTPQPRNAWILVALGWEYNDEFTYPEGEYPQSVLYHDRAAADAECRRLCDEFFAAQTPEEFEIDWESYLPGCYGRPDFDESTVNWDELRKAGFPEPFYVLELTSPGAVSS